MSCYEMKFGALEWAVTGNIFLLLVIIFIIGCRMCRDRRESKRNMQNPYQNPEFYSTIGGRHNPVYRSHSQNLPMQGPNMYSTTTMPTKSSLRPYYIAYTTPSGNSPSSMNIPLHKPCRHNTTSNPNRNSSSPQQLLPVHSCCKKVNIPGYPGRY